MHGCLCWDILGMKHNWWLQQVFTLECWHLNFTVIPFFPRHLGSKSECTHMPSTLGNSRKSELITSSLKWLLSSHPVCSTIKHFAQWLFNTNYGNCLGTQSETLECLSVLCVFLVLWRLYLFLLQSNLKKNSELEQHMMTQFWEAGWLVLLDSQYRNGNISCNCYNLSSCYAPSS